MIIVDTSAVLQMVGARGAAHEPVREVLESFEGPFLLSPVVAAELDYLIHRRLGSDVQVAFLRDLARGAYELCEFSREDVAEAVKVIESYADLELSLADASIVVLARRHKTTDLLSFDERDYRAIAGPGGRPFRLLPADL